MEGEEVTKNISVVHPLETITDWSKSGNYIKVLRPEEVLSDKDESF